METYKKKLDIIRMLEEEGFKLSEKVKKAFLKVPREEFVPNELKDKAYIDMPLPIGHGQTISAPHMVLIMTDRLDVQEGQKILEIGTGSGYQAAILAELIDPQNKGKGHVYTIERLESLAEFARRNLEKTGYSNRVTVLLGDGTLGYPEEAPYDRIIVTAGAPRIPKPLEKQLAVGGKIVIPIGDIYSQTLYIGKKVGEGKIVLEPDTPCLFVPLIGKEGWPNNYIQ